MKRMIYEDLLEWKNRSDRMPLLLEGVRQCGKTYILKEFGEKNYKNTAYFNFEKNPDLCDIFQPDLEPKRIIANLSLILGRSIEPESTLVIFDEIQSCGRAITSLKYFCEEAPEYHIACAGSLLGVLLSKPNSFPVGKVNRLKMGPMCFKEFLLANSEEMLVEYIDRNDPTERLSEPLENKLKTYLDYYFIVGGMPAATAAWVQNKDIKKVETKLDEIIEDFKDSFAKHALESLTKLTMIWESIPIQLARDNKKFIFGHVKTGARSKDLEGALEWIIDAGLVHKIENVDPPKTPLSIYADPTSFKIYMVDIGILRRMAGLPSDFLFTKNKDAEIFRGMIAENFVLNELIASTSVVPYYWKSNGIAEVDFIMQIGMEVIPVEVKAGNNVASKSLSEYIKKYSPSNAVIASKVSGKNGIVHYIPLYVIWRISNCFKGSALVGI